MSESVHAPTPVTHGLGPDLPDAEIDQDPVLRRLASIPVPMATTPMY
jgi:hypothetical protein